MENEFKISQEVKELLDKADKVYNDNFDNKINFTRAVFVSWYCSLGDCKFCFMSTQKDKIKNPDNAKRHPASIFAELYIAKKLNWDIEFISAGYSGVTKEELLRILKYGSKIYGKKLWLNTGFMPKKDLELYLPYLEGISGSIETLSNEHDFVCPSKPIKPYERLYGFADELRLKKAITLIIGIGETEADFNKTAEFIKKYFINRITVYALRPVKGTMFKEPPTMNYYLWWLSKFRIEFPDKEIIGGIWSNDLNSLPYITRAGINLITKFPALKKFGDNWKELVNEREFIGSLNEIPEIDFNKVDSELSFLNESYLTKTKDRIKRYIRLMSRE